MVNRNNFWVGKKTRGRGLPWWCEEHKQPIGGDAGHGWENSFLHQARWPNVRTRKEWAFSVQRLDFHTMVRQVPQSLIWNWANTVLSRGFIWIWKMGYRELFHKPEDMQVEGMKVSSWVEVEWCCHMWGCRHTVINTAAEPTGRNHREH